MISFQSDKVGKHRDPFTTNPKMFGYRSVSVSYAAIVLSVRILVLEAGCGGAG